MITTLRIAVGLTALLALMVCGCAPAKLAKPAGASKQQPAAEVTPVSHHPVSHIPVPVAKPVNPKPASDATPAEKVTAAKPQTFTPPFPQRSNPFVQPDHKTVHVAAQLRRSDDEQGIQLKGFVTVDQPKALLRIDGRVWAAREGETRDGIAVVRIVPPAVTLEREGQQWDVSLRKDG